MYSRGEGSNIVRSDRTAVGHHLVQAGKSKGFCGLAVQRERSGKKREEKKNGNPLRGDHVAAPVHDRMAAQGRGDVPLRHYFLWNGLTVGSYLSFRFFC